jgi:uroporphyrin-3 C-methyltransferase
MVLALAAAGGSYYVWLQHLGAEQERQALRQRIEQLLEVVGQSDAAQRQRIEQLAEHRHAGVEQRLGTLEQSLPALGRQLAVQQRDWSLAEVDYLLRLADHHLQLSHDLPGAIATLRQAEEQLRRYGNGDYSAVAARLAAQIEQLTLLNGQGSAAVSARLTALFDTLEGLPLAALPGEGSTPAKPVAPVTTPDATPNDSAPLGERLRHWGRVVWQDLRSLVTIRHGGAPSHPLPSTEHRQLARTQLRLTLQGARFAVMTRNQPLFDASLQEAVDQLNHNYDTRDGAVLEALAALSGLTTLNVNPALPSLQGLRQQLHAARPSPSLAPVAQPAGAAEANTMESQP